MLAQIAPKVTPALDTATAWLPVLIQGGFATACIILGMVVKTMWARIGELEKQKEEILKQGIADAREEASVSQELIKEMVKEQTKTREVITRLERKLEGRTSP